ncbi:MAG: hypothetical protein Q9174_003544 [Haloplaca sp. 1 TL-2023]
MDSIHSRQAARHRLLHSEMGGRTPNNAEESPRGTSRHANTDVPCLDLSDNQLVSSSGTEASTERPGEYLTTIDLEAAIMRNYQGQGPLDEYDIQTIVIEDSVIYEHDVPPFVSPATIDLTTQTISLVSDHVLAVGGRKIDIIPHQWSNTKKGLKAYETAVINGRAFIVKGFYTADLGRHHKIWLGHRQGFCSHAFLFPVQRYPAEDHTELGNVEDPLSRLAMPSDPFGFGTKELQQPQESNLTTPSLVPLGSISKVRPEEFDDWVARLRSHYTVFTPPFVLSRGDYHDGDMMIIVKATAGGEYPRVHSNTPQYEAKVSLWSSNLIFWTVAANARRYIIRPEQKEGRTSYRRWRGTRRGFDGPVFAFMKDISYPHSAVHLPQSPRSESHHDARSFLKQGRLYRASSLSPRPASNNGTSAQRLDEIIDSSRRMPDPKVEEVSDTNIDGSILANTGHAKSEPQLHAEAHRNDDSMAANSLGLGPVIIPPDPPVRNVTDERPRSRDITTAAHHGNVDLAVNVEGYNLAEILLKDKQHYGVNKPPFTRKFTAKSPRQIAVTLLDGQGERTQERHQISVRKWDHACVYRTLKIQGHECIVVMSQGGSNRQPRWHSYTFRVWFGHEQGLSKMPVARRVPWQTSQGTNVDQYNFRSRGKTPRHEINGAASNPSRPSARTKRSHRELVEVSSDAPRPSKAPRQAQRVEIRPPVTVIQDPNPVQEEVPTIVRQPHHSRIQSQVASQQTGSPVATATETQKTLAKVGAPSPIIYAFDLTYASQETSRLRLMIMKHAEDELEAVLAEQRRLAEEERASNDPEQFA